MNVLMIVAASPYGTDRANTAFRLASALRAADPQGILRIYLVTDGVGAGVAAQSQPDPASNCARQLGALVSGGAQVRMCGLCAEVRGLHSAEWVEGLTMGSMAELAAWTLEADRVLTL